MNDEKIIDLFFERSEQAIVELHQKYGKVCQKVSYNILNNLEDAGECVNDAYLGVWKAIPPQRPNPLLAFVCKIVRNLSLKRYHSNVALKRNSQYDMALDEIERMMTARESVEDIVETKELVKLIQDFLDKLSKENRVIFMRRYWFADSYSEIAHRTGLSEKNVSVRLVRMRRNLQEFLAERGVTV